MDVTLDSRPRFSVIIATYNYAHFLPRVLASVFAQIVEGKLPCHKIYENDSFLAFLDINPIKLGHTLVIPKQEIDYIFDLDDTIYQGLVACAKPIAVAIKGALSCARVGVIVAGYEIPHAHVHLIGGKSLGLYANLHKSI